MTAYARTSAGGLSYNKEPRFMLHPPNLDLTHMRQLTNDWSEQCVVCKVNGKIAQNHRHWSLCDSMQGGEKKMPDAIFLAPITGKPGPAMIERFARDEFQRHK
ncbi:hypothetical protein E4U32_000281 [Claviceps aff. humidiphila group G2b]|nr:hypothetical protein E4U32_000281 [Claviceps aff. humidiphila group G2b]